MTRRGISPVAAKRLLGALTLGVFGDRKVCLWLRLCGAQAAAETPGKAA